MSSGSTSSAALDNEKLAKFVELLVHDYLQTKGFQAAGAKFAEECSKGAEGGAGSSASDGADEAGSWYCLSDKLALPVGVQSKGCRSVYLRTSCSIARVMGSERVEPAV